jgi:molybdenum cofactor cytidylyltransferase
MESAAIVLAAGLGRRMGGPKALLEHGGRALVARHVDAFAALCVRSYVVVRPELSQRVRELLCATHAVIVESDAATQSGSLVRALEVLAAPCATLFVTPVDLLPAASATLLSLRAALCEEHEAVTPSYRGEGGHPVLVRRRLLAPFLRMNDPPSLRSLLEAAGKGRLRLQVDDPHVVHDFDTPRQAVDAGLTRPW